MEERIISILKNRRGKDRAMFSDQIAELIQIEDEDPRTNFKTRVIIRKIIDDLTLPIGSCGKGYFLIETEAELQEYVDTLNSRAWSILVRKANVIKAFRNFHPPKLKLREKPKAEQPTLGDF